MSDNPRALPPSTPNVVYERSPTFTSFFTNTFRYLPMPGEITFTFGLLRGSPTGGPVTVVDEAEIVMTYQQLKNFYEHIAAFIALYEQEIGRIETPPASAPDMTPINGFVANLKQVWRR